MRTIDSNLQSALANQQGELILRVNTWTDAADYNSNPSTPDHVWTVKAFTIEATTASAELVTANDYTLSEFTVFTIERGVTLLGVEYTIESGLYHVRKYTEDYGKIKIDGSSYPNQKINIAAGDGTYQEVIEAFCTAIGKTAVFKNDSDPWLAYQFLPTGKALSLNKAELFENLLKQKYCILVYEESPNNLVFYNQDSFPSLAFKAITSNGSNQLAAVATSGAAGVSTSANATLWTSRTAPTFYNDVAYGSVAGEPDVYVAVGASVAATSPDGITWTSRTIPAGTYNSIAWSSSLSLFVAVGTDICATSPDGRTWTARTITLRNWISITWSSTLAIFVAVSDIISTSTNGTTWTNNTETTTHTWTARTASADTSWQSIVWAPSLALFAAVSNSGTVMTSPDGITWTSRTATAALWSCIAWSPSLSLFVAVADSGTTAISSPDGITWTDRTIGSGQYRGVAWSAELGIFVAVGNNIAASSTNGTSWTARTPADTGLWMAVTWSPTLAMFAAVATSGTNRVMTSTNGTTWTARTAAEANSWRAISWSPSLAMFAAVALDGSNRVMTSTNGTSWTARTAASVSQWVSITWSDELELFYSGGTGGELMSSANGTSWTARTAAESNGWYGIAWSAELGILVAVGILGSGTHSVMTCSTTRYTNLKASTWSGSLFAIVGVDTCYTSTDGTTWTSRTIPAGTYNGITYGNSLFVAIGAGVCATSPDGTTWTARTPANSNTWQDVLYASFLSLFVAVASDGGNRVMTSADGITWSVEPAESDFDLSYLDGPASNLNREQSEVHFIWRDEDSSVHTLGDTTLPQWNLGFLHSTASPPITRQDAYYKIYLKKAPVRLDITDSDKIHFTPYWSIDPTKTIDAMMQVTEHLNLSQSPAWYQEIKSIVLFNKTEGGALPSTIERVAAYTPLVSTGFDGNLTPSVNNLQAFAQAVDDMQLFDVIGGHGDNATIPASTTYYITPFLTGLQTTAKNYPYPVAGVLKNLYLRTPSSQPASGSLVLTLMVGGVDTALVLTIPAGSGAGVYSETSTSVSIAAGALVRIKIQNNATAASCQIGGVSLAFKGT